MFLKKLRIINQSQSKIIREINFQLGLNLIVDETDITIKTQTGNSVGKTTVLKLINFCLGGDSKSIYTDEESKNKVDEKVKDFLLAKNILIELTITDSLTTPNKKILLERNFLKYKNGIRRIDGINYNSDNDYEKKIGEILYPTLKTSAPTFKQLKAHNIRYKNNRIENTLKILDPNTTDTEYEQLMLFMLGILTDEAENKNLLNLKLKTEIVFKNRLEKNMSKNEMETSLSAIRREIEVLNQNKEQIVINQNYDNDLKQLNEVRKEISYLSSQVSKYSIRKQFIEETLIELTKENAKINSDELIQIYQQAKINIGQLGKTFEELVIYHNQMVQERKRYIAEELPDLTNMLAQIEGKLDDFLVKEKAIYERVKKGDTFKDYEKIVNTLGEKYRLEGEYSSKITQIEDIEIQIKSLNIQLKEIENNLFNSDFKDKLQLRRDQFNAFFEAVSKALYDETYLLNYEIGKDKKTNKNVYIFNTFNLNMSSGKKQGEIICFDIAYTQFADSLGLDTLHFLLNDKKELMHGNQLIQLSNYIKDKNIQIVISILKDKLPTDYDFSNSIVLRLSSNKKLFLIEET